MYGRAKTCTYRVSYMTSIPSGSVAGLHVEARHFLRAHPRVAFLHTGVVAILQQKSCNFIPTHAFLKAWVGMKLQDNLKIKSSRKT